MSARADVAILGGGLAGLSLALQLKRRDPALSVLVLERRAHPVREAAFKVGESTVEIGAHYFAEALGLRRHLDTAQVRKFGFRFFFSDSHDDPAHCTELGVSRVFPTPTWQLDRGRFENFLGEQVRAHGVDFRDGAVVRGVALTDGDGDHVLHFDHAGAWHTLSARWVVDASGRAGLLKRQLGLAQANGHDCNAVWWRVAGIVDPHDWSDTATWQARCTPAERWRSTNHLCGPGYWVWMIPLASGSHSLGIVCDARLHPLETMHTHAAAMAWLRRHQPALARLLERPRHVLQDFLFLRSFSYGCRQVFGHRWALTGEAGLFLDPFYSPGSDFIAIANTYICELVARERAGQPFAPHAALFQQLYFSFYDTMLALYRGQYPLFGDAQVMPLKVLWDYTLYWGLLAPLYCSGRIADLRMLSRLRPAFDAARALNAAMQPLLREWGARNPPRFLADGRWLDQHDLPWFGALNRALGEHSDDDAFAARIAANLTLLRTLAAELLRLARARHPALSDHGLTVLLAGAGADDPLLPAAWATAAAEADATA